MIVATAGHVDHGKTSLVRALTGIDTDRLAEEKRRGMSIDLGFAYADFGGDAPTGFVDVPGHERFLRNMLAGVAAIDVALLVIAADDGPMPQTREHLAILDLLGVRRGVIALTKTDRVSADRHAQARVEIASLLADSALRDAPVFPVATPSGQGIDALRAHLCALAGSMPRAAVNGEFRLAIDRVFTMPGAGLVVAGPVVSGMARPGDALLLSPSGMTARVRGIHAQGRPSELACAGARCAINLQGPALHKQAVGRGDWLLAPPANVPSGRIDAHMMVLRGESRPLAHWAAVHLHIGARACSARIALLDAREIPPGGQGLAQIVPEAPLVAVRGDRFIVRDVSARRTIGGGMVIDPFGVERGRTRPSRLSALRAMSLPTPAQAFAALLELATQGMPLAPFHRAWNQTAEESAALLANAAPEVFVQDGVALAIAPAHAQNARSRLLAALADHHAAHPDSLGATRGDLAVALGDRRLLPADAGALRSLLASGQCRQEGAVYRLPAHRPLLSPPDAALLSRIAAALAVPDLRPPIIGELAAILGIERDALRDALERFARLGHLVRVAPNRFFLPSTVSALADAARALAASAPDGSFDAAAYRDHTGIGRNLTIQVLEYLDRLGVTRFMRERRWISDAPTRPC